MRIGIAIQMGGGTPGAAADTASGWTTIREEALAAERAGFDLLVIEDVLMEAGPGARSGYWESVAMAGAIAETTSTIELSHSMVNTPYRTPTRIAHMAATLDEISGGRYRLGLGAGNTTDEDYAAAGVPSDHRFSRFAEAVEIIHGLLRDGAVDYEGRFQQAKDAELTLSGPSATGPPMVIAAWGPRMMKLAARFADEWNGWALALQTVESFRPMIDKLEQACAEVGRDPATLTRTLDLTVHAAAATSVGAESELAPYLIDGSGAEELAERLLAFEALGVEEVRCYLNPRVDLGVRAQAIADMTDLVSLVHSG